MIILFEYYDNMKIVKVSEVSVIYIYYLNINDNDEFEFKLDLLERLSFTSC